jgi:hypothetical protein
MVMRTLRTYMAWLRFHDDEARTSNARPGEVGLLDDPMNVDLTLKEEVAEICREEINTAQKSCLKTSQEKYEVSHLPETMVHPVFGNVGSKQVTYNRTGSDQVWEKVWDPMEEDSEPRGQDMFKGAISDPKPEQVQSSGWAAKMEGRAPACNDTLGTTTFADLIGWDKFRGERQLEKAAAFSVAHYRSIDPIDGDDVDVRAKVGFVESLKQGVNKLGGRVEKHNTKHRASNRFHRRVIVVKTLVNGVKFEAPGTFTASEADRRALHLIVRRVVRDALEKGVELPGGKVTIRDQEKAWYLEAVRTAYYIQEEDDVFWARLAAHGSAVTH